nr:hypothetical protein Iba_chr05bCG1980 [Ipomoea batatas]GMC94858.1 hypothetical protein Iba_chr05cCG2990 [Ipomoea batatas]GMC96911.1 hypothetical protein Iba_chr05dCG2050 [Ipomoea batatas]GMC99073.1 hypothetical protein Iba_chr05eCG2240 [Ipomoea batatas]GMD00802.1 hypothetical protein Iba_chr05fCG1330 [Ipomoea batatas]
MVNKELLIIPKIKFSSNKDYWDTRSIMCQLRNPLARNILIAGFTNERKCQNENISSTVTQRS